MARAARLPTTGRARRAAARGGAVLPELAAHEDSFQSHLEQGVDTKVRLARAVIDMINPHEAVFVDSSSTAWYIVRELVEAALPVTVLTNLLPVMTIVGGADVPNVAMIGRARTVQLVAQAHTFDDHGLNVVVGADAVHTAHLAGASAAGQKLFHDAGAEVRVV